MHEPNQTLSVLLRPGWAHAEGYAGAPGYTWPIHTRAVTSILCCLCSSPPPLAWQASLGEMLGGAMLVLGPGWLGMLKEHCLGKSVLCSHCFPRLARAVAEASFFSQPCCSNISCPGPGQLQRMGGLIMHTFTHPTKAGSAPPVCASSFLCNFTNELI